MVQIDLFATGVALTIGSSKIGVEALRWGDRGVRQRDDTGIAGRYGVGDLDAIADGSPVKENAVDVLANLPQAKQLIRRPDLLDRRNYPSSQDCQRSLVEQIQLGCQGKGEESGFDEADKIGVAISMTLCSISSALQSPPSECEPWSPFCEPAASTSSDRHDRCAGGNGLCRGNQLIEGHDMARRSYPRDDEGGRAMRGRCLEALHRSPQDWSSYNGYLSDATQLCHAFQSKQILDTAQKLYYNSSMEKLSLIKMLKGNEIARRDAEQETALAWEERVQAFDPILTSLTQAQTFLTSHLTQTRQTQEDHLRQLESAITSTLARKGDLWEEVRRDAQGVVEQLEVGLKDMIVRGSGEVAGVLGGELEQIVRSHDQALLAQRSTYETFLLQLMAKIEDRSLSLQSSEQERLDIIGQRVVALQEAVGVASSALALVAGDAGDIQPALQLSLHLIGQAQDQALHHLQATQTLSTDIETSLENAQTAARAGEVAWKELYTEMQGERRELEERAEARKRSGWGWGLAWVGPVAQVAVNSIAASLFGLSSQQIFAIITGKYPLVLSALHVLGYLLGGVMAAMSWSIWLMSGLYVLVKTGVWRIGRRLAKTMIKIALDLYTELINDGETGFLTGTKQEDEESGGIDSRSGAKIRLPVSPEYSPKKRGLAPSALPTDSLDFTGFALCQTRSLQHRPTPHSQLAVTYDEPAPGDNFRPDDPPAQYTSTKHTMQLRNTTTRQKRSLGSRIDDMRIRAQSEPLL